jgi:type IV pilus assembly protein PilP
MRMPNRQSFSFVLLFLMIFFLSWGCGGKEEPAKAPVVSKKIAVKSKARAPEEGEPAKRKTSAKKPENAMVGQEVQTTTRIYDPTQRIDPFAPIFGEKKDTEEKERKRKKRIPQTPLERISLDQLKLVAIIRASTGNRALVEDAIGKGYIIRNGTYIGLNSGMVTQINANSVIVEEEVQDLKGDFVLQSTEIKLQKPAGE